MVGASASESRKLPSVAREFRCWGYETVANNFLYSYCEASRSNAMAGSLD